MNQKNPWKTLSSNIKYKNQYITVIEDKVIKPGGKKGIYGYVKVRQTIGIVPVDNNNNIYLCKQFRYIFKEESWEIPRGFIGDGEMPDEAALRELEEEAGLTSNKLTLIGSLRLSIGLINEQCKIYIAQNLSQSNKFINQEDEIKEVKIFTLRRIQIMIKEGKILDGLTVGAILMAKEKLNF